MPRPWTLIESVDSPGGRLDLHRRGENDFMISVGGRVLMSSLLHKTELAVSELACARLTGGASPRVLIGGLGLGYSLRAALDALPPRASVTVAELSADVVRWCRGPLHPLTLGAVDDARVEVKVADVCDVIRGASPGEYDAIILDLYEGPRDLPRGSHDPLYGTGILRSTARALRDGGVYSVWTEEPNAAFERRLGAVGLASELVRCGGRGPRHAVYVATRSAAPHKAPRTPARGRRR